MTRHPRLSGPLDIRSTLNRSVLRSAPLPMNIGMGAGHWALQKFAPDIPEPSSKLAVMPVVGSAWQAAEDLQDGDYAPALVNGALAGLEVFPAFAGATQAARVEKVTKALEYERKAGSRPLTDRNVRDAFSKAELTGKETGQEAHHTFPFNGVDRKPANWRNSPWLVEPRPTAIHRRITGSWRGQPRFGPLSRAWYESSDLLKAGLGGAAAYAADLGENLLRDDKPQKPPQKPKPQPL